MPTRQSPYILLCLAAATVLAAGCAGYQVVARSLQYPAVRTVYVPIFESVSLRRNLAEQLTEAVVKQLEAKTSYKVVSDPLADSVLSGQIATEKKRVAARRKTGEGRNIETTLTVRVNWTDRHGNLLGQGHSIAIPALKANVSGTSNAIPEAGQSVAYAHQKTIEQVAEQIVSQLEIPW